LVYTRSHSGIKKCPGEQSPVLSVYPIGNGRDIKGEGIHKGIEDLCIEPWELNNRSGHIEPRDL
jgi:hypothetical protein